MLASLKQPLSEKTRSDNPEKGCRCPDLDKLSDRLLNAMQTSVIFFDAEGVVTRMNTLAREDLHITEDPRGGKLSELLLIIYHGRNILPELISRFDCNETEKVGLPRDTLMRTKNSTALFFVSGCITRLDEGNFLLSFRNIVDEVTQEYMLKMALSSTKIFPWFYDLEKRTMIIDSRYFDYTGIESPDNSMTLEAFSERLHPDDRATMANAFTLQLNGEHYPYPVQFRLRRGDNRYEWFEGQSTYLGQVEDMPYRVVGVCMSTQAHKDIEEALTTAKNKAEQNNKLKSAFLANISHELRTPLNAIVGFTNLLVGGEISADSEEGKEYVELINKNCDYLLSLVSDILDLSRIETGAMEYSFKRFSLGQFLTDFYQNRRHTIPEGVKFNLLLPPEDIQIESDMLRLQQVLDNLLNNANKFTGQGHIDLGYTLSSEGKSVRLFVADTGRGISGDQLEKIFERFYKGDTFVQGVGLGLSICKVITEQLGGTITVSSRPKEGSRFTVRLPIRQQDKI